MPPPPPIVASSHRRFGVVFLLTVVACFLAYTPAALIWVNYYTHVEAGWVEYLYRQKSVVDGRTARAGNRLLLVGGSGVLFGIDAELLSMRLHRPVVNLGTHAALGLRYLLDRAARFVRPGDAVLLVPEYELWQDDNRDDNDLFVPYVWSYDPAYLRQMPIREAARVVGSIRLDDWRESAVGWWNHRRGRPFYFGTLAKYNVATLSDAGDLRVNFVPPAPVAGLSRLPFPTVADSPSVGAVRDFADRVRRAGGRLLFGWPQAAKQPGFTIRQPAPPWLSATLHDAGYDVVDAPTDNLYPASWFMDTVYHCSPACRRVRTDELSERLRPRFGFPERNIRRDTPLFLVGPDSRPTRGNVFDDASMSRLVSDVPDSRAIRADTVRDLLDRGGIVYADDGVTVSGCTAHAVNTQSTTVARWLGGFAAHVIVASKPAGPVARDVGDVVDPALDTPLARTVVWGTGPFVGHRLVATNLPEAPLNRAWPAAAAGLPMIVGANVGRITVDYGTFAAAGPGQIAIAVIDPAEGVVADVKIVTANSVELWRTRVLERTHSATTPTTPTTAPTTEPGGSAAGSPASVPRSAP